MKQMILNKKIKVLVVDDSALTRKIITDILKSDKLIELVGTAKNGEECIRKVQILNPDIITLDIEMPIMDGIDTLKELKKIKPFPMVLILSNLSTAGAESTLKALELGAVDFITKPKGVFLKENINYLKSELLSKIRSLQNSGFVYKPGKEIMTQEGPIKRNNYFFKTKNIDYLVGIASSTGGPKALQSIITLMPYDIPASIFIVQHMPAGFTKPLAERLDSISQIHVKEAENGETVKRGYAYIAPGEFHMEVKEVKGEYEIMTNKKPPVKGHRPSANVLMESLANISTKNLLAVIMTGMGSDGADGMKKIKSLGGKTIAQDEKTSVVFGMPRSAIEANAIDIVLPLQDISKQLLEYMGVK